MKAQEAIVLEETRLSGIEEITEYPSFHERHRIFPALFENRNHKRVFDTSAGVGAAAQRVHTRYPAELLCNEISPTALKILSNLGIKTVSFDLDTVDTPFPLSDGQFDAVMSLATIEHIINVDHFVKEIHRILSPNGYFYLSTPNYAGLLYFRRFVVSGRSFHNPLSDDPYEFYAHVRYFTYKTLVEYVSSFGFVPEAVYLGVPKESTRYQTMLAHSKPKAMAFKYGLTAIYKFFSPRWAAEPVICFRKGNDTSSRKIRKVVL